MFGVTFPMLGRPLPDFLTSAESLPPRYRPVFQAVQCLSRQKLRKRWASISYSDGAGSGSVEISLCNLSLTLTLLNRSVRTRVWV